MIARVVGSEDTDDELMQVSHKTNSITKSIFTVSDYS